MLRGAVVIHGLAETDGDRAGAVGGFAWRSPRDLHADPITEQNRPADQQNQQQRHADHDAVEAG